MGYVGDLKDANKYALKLITGGKRKNKKNVRRDRTIDAICR